MTAGGWGLRRSLDARLDAALLAALSPPERQRRDFLEPAHEPALLDAGSVSWRVFANPVAVFVGGVAAVVLELAEPRVRTGVWEHTRFRDEPYRRLQRTGFATMMSVYGPRSRAEALIATVVARHARVHGRTPAGIAYRASDPELLCWVHATAAYGFLRAHEAFVEPLSVAERDAYYAEAAPTAARFGAGQVPASAAEVESLFETMGPGLEASPIVDDFLRITRTMPALPVWLRPWQSVMVSAAVDLLPPWLVRRVGLRSRPAAAAIRRGLVRCAARQVGRAALPSHPRKEAMQRLGPGPGR